MILMLLFWKGSKNFIYIENGNDWKMVFSLNAGLDLTCCDPKLYQISGPSLKVIHDKKKN